MTINGINGVNTQAGQMGMNQMTDSFSRNIQNQISNAQKQLQELSSNEEMTPEEKMKKKQELQQQISDLNTQLRQHQMEQRREKQQAKDSSIDDLLGGTRNSDNAKSGRNAGLSQASMAAIISADSSMNQAKATGSVATSLNGKAGVLESEMKLDSSRGVSVEKKKEELADTQQKAQAATASQISTLAEAGKKMEEAAKADREEEKKEQKEEKTKQKEDKADGKNTSTDATSTRETSTTEETAAQTVVYTPIDIRL